MEGETMVGFGIAFVVIVAAFLLYGAVKARQSTERNRARGVAQLRSFGGGAE